MNVLEELKSRANAADAEKLAQIHKVDRQYLGLENGDIDAVVKAFQKKRSVEELISEAQSLWATDIFEARIAAGKILTKGRLQPDDDQAIWQATLDFASEFDSWAIADHMALAAHKRVLNQDDRWKELEAWAKSNHMWRKRAALEYTLPFTRLGEPTPSQLEARETILGWANDYLDDETRYIQKSVSWWLRDLSRKDPKRVAEFTKEHGDFMKPWALKEATKYL